MPPRRDPVTRLRPIVEIPIDAARGRTIRAPQNHANPISKRTHIYLYRAPHNAQLGECPNALSTRRLDAYLALRKKTRANRNPGGSRTQGKKVHARRGVRVAHVVKPEARQPADSDNAPKCCVTRWGSMVPPSSVANTKPLFVHASPARNRSCAAR